MFTRDKRLAKRLKIDRKKNPEITEMNLKQFQM